jgi:ferredoxin-NADP reductase
MIPELLGSSLMGLTAVGAGAAVLRQIRRDQFERKRQNMELALLRGRLEADHERRLVQSRSTLPWNGFRKFVVKRKVVEAEGLCSLYLAPHDGKGLPEFMPGQYLTFQLPVQGQQKPVIRCYSLSDRPRQDYYRITVKRLPAPEDSPGAPPGVGSNHFHDRVNEGDIIDVKAPGGQFFLDPAGNGGLVLVGGGVGVTPILSMLNTLVGLQSRREVWFFYSVRNNDDHMMRDSLQTIARENPNVHLVVCYSRPHPHNVAGQHFDEAGRISVELLRRILPSNNFDFYMCGPGGLMEGLTRELHEWGVPANRVHFETFGPSSVKNVGSVTRPPMPLTKRYSVSFKRSGKSADWTGGVANLLELAEQSGVAIASGCRSGNCGTCVVAVQAGEIEYVQKPGSTPDPGTCLTCVAMPKGDLVLDA